jgi:uncharacterized protein YutE (UPF0331/DUF86 family)
MKFDSLLEFETLSLGTSNSERYGSAERFLHLSIEAILDMGNHVIADLDLGIVNWYSDIPALLEKNGVRIHYLPNACPACPAP